MHAHEAREPRPPARVARVAARRGRYGQEVRTTDRGEILHLSGRHRLSPALRDGAPLLVPVGDTAGRCGWAPFFEALARAGLAVAEEGDEVRLVPRRLLR